MKKLFIASVISLFILALAACGSDTTSSDSQSGDSEDLNTVELLASNWQFDQDTYTVPAGDIIFKLVNESGFHGVVIEGTDVKIEKAGSKTANLEAGEYTIRCIIPCGEGHGEMTAKLIVE